MVKKILLNNSRIDILCDEKEAEMISDLLWRSSYFIPHSIHGEPNSQYYPVLIFSDISNYNPKGSVVINFKQHFLIDSEEKIDILLWECDPVKGFAIKAL